MKETEVIIGIAGIRLGFRMRSSALLKAMERRYRGYLPTGRKGQTTLQVTCTRGYFQHPLDTVEVGGAGRQYTIRRKDFVAEWEGNTGTLHLHESIYAFDACLRIMLSIFIVADKGFLLHSSGIAIGDRAYIFSGRSEAGKTTIARLSGKKILNDEIVALRLSESGRLQVHGTPFWGEMGTGPVYARSYRPVGIYFLHQSAEIRKESLRLAESLTRFLQVVCYFDKRPENTRKILTLAIQVLQLLPQYQLFFQKNNRFLEVLD